MRPRGESSWDWTSRRSQRIRATGRSDVAEVLKLAERPDVISFAGGLPDPRTYLTDAFAEVAREVMTSAGAAALGYGPTPGITPMREWLAERMDQMGRPTEADEILVTTGGIAALDLIVKAFIDPGDVVIVGEPSYLAALHVFRSYQARFAGVAVDREGMVPDALEETLNRLDAAGNRPGLIYVMPSFHNPSGVTLPEARRRRIVDLAARFDVPIVEDEAYHDLRFEGVAPPLLAALDPDRVIHINTLSKSLNPGVRLGWAVASPALIEILVAAKQGQDQCSGTLCQHIAYRFARQGHLDAQIAGAVAVYRQKRDVMLRALEAHMPPGTQWTRPAGGFYSWLTLPEGLDGQPASQAGDSDALLAAAIERKKVAYVPGPAFFHDSTGQRRLRLCYSYVTEQTIDDGIARLASLLRGQ